MPHRASAPMRRKPDDPAADETEVGMGRCRPQAQRGVTVQRLPRIILDWAKDDGGATIVNMGFPYPADFTS